MLSQKRTAAVTLPHDERRLSRRRLLNRVAKIRLGNAALPRDCLITDISDGGVRLHVEGFDVPDEFVLLLSGDDIKSKGCAYKVVWRSGFEIGAKFLGPVRLNGNQTAG
jgi:PilZ domain